MRIMFVEPPKDYWFVMGEYLPPPLGILNLAAYLREHDDTLQIEIVDCNAERISWGGLKARMEALRVVGSAENNAQGEGWAWFESGRWQELTGDL